MIKPFFLKKFIKLESTKPDGEKVAFFKNADADWHCGVLVENFGRLHETDYCLFEFITNSEKLAKSKKLLDRITTFKDLICKNKYFYRTLETIEDMGVEILWLNGDREKNDVYLPKVKKNGVTVTYKSHHVIANSLVHYVNSFVSDGCHMIGWNVLYKPSPDEKTAIFKPEYISEYVKLEFTETPNRELSFMKDEKTNKWVCAIVIEYIDHLSDKSYNIYKFTSENEVKSEVLDQITTFHELLKKKRNYDEIIKKIIESGVKFEWLIGYGEEEGWKELKDDNTEDENDDSGLKCKLYVRLHPLSTGMEFYVTHYINKFTIDGKYLILE